MDGEATPAPDPAFDLARAPAAAPAGLWATVVGSVDAMLRAYYGIREFTDDPDCLFRVALVPAGEPVRLSDGTEIAAGEPIGALHWWNEHMPRYSDRGPDLVWAGMMRRRVGYSLQLLIEFAEREPEWRQVRAFRGDTTLASGLGNGQTRRVARHLGFELIEPPPSRLHRLHTFTTSFNTWALTRAFNPAALPRQPFLRGWHEWWMSRAMLRRRYARSARHRAIRPAIRSGDRMA